MINVKDAWSIAHPSPPRGEAAPLTEREWMLLGYLETQLDNGICQTFCGEIFHMRIPKERFGSAVVAALQQKYREGGWLVSAFEYGEDVQLIFAPGTPAAL